MTQVNFNRFTLRQNTYATTRFRSHACQNRTAGYKYHCFRDCWYTSLWPSIWQTSPPKGSTKSTSSMNMVRRISHQLAGTRNKRGGSSVTEEIAPAPPSSVAYNTERATLLLANLSIYPRCGCRQFYKHGNNDSNHYEKRDLDMKKNAILYKYTPKWPLVHLQQVVSVRGTVISHEVNDSREISTWYQLLREKKTEAILAWQVPEKMTHVTPSLHDNIMGIIHRHTAKNNVEKKSRLHLDTQNNVTLAPGWFAHAL